jgi:hypothetical protein
MMTREEALAQSAVLACINLVDHDGYFTFGAKMSEEEDGYGHAYTAGSYAYLLLPNEIYGPYTTVGKVFIAGENVIFEISHADIDSRKICDLVLLNGEVIKDPENADDPPQDIAFVVVHGDYVYFIDTSNRVWKNAKLLFCINGNCHAQRIIEVDGSVYVEVSYRANEPLATLKDGKPFGGPFPG